MDFDVPVVDAHVHFNRFDAMTPAARALIEQNPTFAQMERLVAHPEEVPAFLDEEGVEEAWAINYCAREVMGYGAEVNAWAAGFADATAGRVRSTGGYEPQHDGDGAAAAAGLADLGLIGCKVHPVHQHLAPDAHRGDGAVAGRLASLYAELESRGMPVWFHTGTSIFPGADNRFADLAPMERVAQDHPRLQVVLCHGGRPLQCQEALAMVARNANVWMDVSSMPPERIQPWFPDLESVSTRVLWGSDWPGPKVPGMGENVLRFLAQGWPAHVAKGVLHENALRLVPR